MDELANEPKLMIAELVLTVCVFLVASIPVLRLLGRTRLSALLLLGVFTLIVGSVWFNPKSQTSSSETLRPVEVRAHGYVTSKSCRSCHPGEHHSWHHSFHRTMTQVANQESVVGDFNNVKLSVGARKLRLHKKDGNFYVAIQRVDDPTRYKDHEIMLTTGSHHMQFYWYATGQGRKLGKLPFVFLFSEQRWVPADSTFLRPPSAHGSLSAGQWNQNCISCHSTGPQPRLSLAQDGSAFEAMDTHVGEFGIACEACHGPGETHVRNNSNALQRYGTLLGLTTQKTISQPDDILPGTRSQICGQCHGISLPASQSLFRNVFWDGFNYRPGGDFLSKTSDRILVQNDLRHPMIAQSLARDAGYLRSYFWPDGMVRVSGREFNGLVNSPCFTHQDDAKGVMQCMSCHTMHPADGTVDLAEWSDDQLGPKMQGDEACLQCHAEFEEEATRLAHTHHENSSAGSRCYNCHMPHTTYGLFKGIRSHTVSSPSADETVFLGRPNACNLCHLDKSLDWTAQHLADWYAIEAPPLDTKHTQFAASVLWATQGDAGVRALVSWHMGWRPAVEAAGEQWMPPLLGLLMSDPYDAVRYVAYHALRSKAGFDDLSFDYVDKAAAADIPRRVLQRWNELLKAPGQRPRTDHSLLMDDRGEFDGDAMQKLLQQRDEREVLLNE